MNNKITITELTKKELLELIVRRGLQFSISDRDIERVRWNTIIRRAQALVDEACTEIELYRGPQNYPKYKKAIDKFDKFGLPLE